MKRFSHILFNLLFLFGTHLSFGSNGYFVSIEPLEMMEEHQYLSFVQSDVRHTLQHINCLPSSPITKTPSTAVVVGAGTIGMECIVAATRLLPHGSTIMIIQNDIKNPTHLTKLLTKEIPNGHAYTFIASNPTDIGNKDGLETFFNDNKEPLKQTLLYFHTADRAERFVPDSLEIDSVLTQIVRRTSIAYINNIIESAVFTERPIIKILTSSECTQNRSDYKIPNLGPYQVGKIVGDELFLQARHRKNSVTAILYSGAMGTLGQVKARTQEYQLLTENNVSIKASSADEYVRQNRESVDIDPMDSVGAMIHAMYTDYISGHLSFGKMYKYYGQSVNPELGHPINTLELIEPTDFMWPPLEAIEE